MRPRALTALLVVAAALLALRRFDVVEVRGRSMAPTLLPGDRLLVMRARARQGDVVLAHDPRHPARELIKRVASVEPDGVVLRGDNVAASNDARVASEGVRWRAVVRYWPPARAGRLPSPHRSVVTGGGPPLSGSMDERANHAAAFRSQLRR
jgi:signal peptidase I